MSFLIGPISGALAAGGVYYGLSSMMSNSIQIHRNDMQSLSNRLQSPESQVSTSAPPRAADRIQQTHYPDYLKYRWNNQLEIMLERVREVDDKISAWGRRVLYGGDANGSQQQQQKQ
ncbi:hypothetical protein K474DRAFT_78892 [Panus rudis PR-1116 ss-1]|nr:hypothetical protein K474DRAFT_78892 [Panus rudis PR-1116 ss-1]